MVNSFVNKSCTQPMNGSVCTNEGSGFLLFRGRGILFSIIEDVAMPLTQAKNGDKQFWK